MTTFVLLTEDNQAVYLVQLLNALNNENEAKRQAMAVQQAKMNPNPTKAIEDLEGSEATRCLTTPLGQYVANEKYYELIEHGFFQSINKIMVSKVADIDTAFTLVFSLLPRLRNSSRVQNVINKLASCLSSNHREHPALKLRLLAILFNLLGPRSYIRHTILMNIFELALSSQRPKLPLTFVKPLDDWIKAWSQTPDNFPPEKVATTYLKVAELAEAAKDMKKKQDYMYKYVKALEGVKSIDEPHFKWIAKAVIEALKVAGGPNATTIVTDCGRLVEMSAVKALENKAGYAKLFKLLRIFASKPVADYIKFYEENENFISDAGLNHEDCLSRLRTLTLCDLGMEHESLTFKELEEKLVIKGGDDEIEEAILNAVMAKKIDAKIDEAESKVLILRASWRCFRNDDWRFLAQKLNNWKTALDSVITETFDKRGHYE